MTTENTIYKKLKLTRLLNNRSQKNHRTVQNAERK